MLQRFNEDAFCSRLLVFLGERASNRFFHCVVAVASLTTHFRTENICC